MKREVGCASLAAALLSLGACSSRIESTLSVTEGYTAHVAVLGERPFVEVRNLGPSTVYVDIAVPAQAAAWGQELQAKQWIGRGTSNGPLDITITAERGEAVVALEAQRATGIEIRGPVPAEGEE